MSTTQSRKAVPAGRQRVSIACIPCRKKRKRCDGFQPCCGTCQARNVQCEYQGTGNNRKPPSKRYMESLQARIRVLEEHLVSLGSPPDHLWAQVDPSSGSNDGNDYIDSDIESTDHSVHQKDLAEEIAKLYGRLSLDEDGQLRYFSAQSNYHLLNGLEHCGPSQTVQRIQEQGLSALSMLGKKVEISLELQEHLLDLYFRWQNPWVYVVEKEVFMRDFRNQGSGKYCTLLLLSSILALAARFSDRKELRTNPDDPNTAGDALAEQARILLLYESEAGTVTTVQSAALLSIRWMAENKEPAGWLYMGMATRMAFNIGLHLDSSKWVKSGLITKEEAEVRKVAWWGCYTLDKLFSIGLGRPSSTRECDITCGKPTIPPATEFETWTAADPGNEELLGAHARVISVSHYVTEHLRIASEVLDQIYAPNSRLSRKDIENLISKGDVALNTFRTCLPTYLRLPVSSNVPCLPHVYQLHIQYHTTQILIHRPLIARRKVETPSGHPEPDPDDEHRSKCRQSACEITRIIRIYHKHYGLRLAPAGPVCHTFTAAVIHLMDASSPDPVLRHQSISQLQVCISALKEMGIAWSWSYRALRAIQLLACQWLAPQEFKRESISSQNLESHPSSGSPRSGPSPNHGSPINEQFETSSNTPQIPAGSMTLEDSAPNHRVFSPLLSESALESYLEHSNDLDWLLDYKALDSSTASQIFSGFKIMEAEQNTGEFADLMFTNTWKAS